MKLLEGRLKGTQINTSRKSGLNLHNFLKIKVKTRLNC
jgi:hypothetical protein